MSPQQRSKFFDIPRIKRESEVDLIVFEKRLESTNSLALDRASEWSDHRNVLVLADEQTAGRGRGRNSWWSSEGALTMSLVTRGEFLTGGDWTSGRVTPATIALWVGESICAALESMAADEEGARLGLKWPNDIWLADRKLGGVLIEVPAGGGCLVVGLGLNINNSFDSAPEDVRQIATSTFDHWKRKLPLSDVVIAVIRELQVQLEIMRNGEPTTSPPWQGRSVLDGRMVQFRFGDRTIRARCAGIGSDGALLLETNAGVERFVAGTIDRID